MAMDLSKNFSVPPLACSHPEAMDLAKKPEWYHRRPTSPFRTRSSSSYSARSSRLQPDTPPPPMEQLPESLGSYRGPSLTRGLDLDLYRDHRRDLWPRDFYGHEQNGSPVPESSGGEESDSGSDVIFLVSTAKEPLLCGPFIQDGVSHIVEPLSPTASSLEDGTACYHLPQPLSSPSPESSSSDDSSDSSLDIPLHHARPVVLLSDLNGLCENPSEFPGDVSSDSSDVVEVAVTHNTIKSSSCKKARRTGSPSSPLSPPLPSRSDDGRNSSSPSREVRRSNRIRKSPSVPEEPVTLSHSPSRHRLKRRAKNDSVGIYNETCDLDDMIELAARLSSSDGDEKASLPKVEQRLRRHDRNLDGSAGQVVTEDRKSELHCEKPGQQRAKQQQQPKKQQMLSVRKVKMLKSIERKQQQNTATPERRHKSASTKTAVRRRKKKKKKRQPAGSAACFPPHEPEIKLKFAAIKEEKREKRQDAFRPFVHVERRTCTVVNDQQEAAKMKSSRAPERSPVAAVSTFVPSTSCFQLGHLTPEGRCSDTLLCCLCRHTANAMGLGDLHGPYLPVGRPPRLREVTEVKDSVVGPSGEQQGSQDECWIHEDCGIWSAGVFLVRGRLYGLAEAARLAQETVSRCPVTPTCHAWHRFDLLLIKKATKQQM